VRGRECICAKFGDNERWEKREYKVWKRGV